MALSDLDGHALARGGLVAAAIAVPVSIVANVFVDQDHTSGWNVLLSLAVLVGLAIGAALAAREQDRGTPLTHGIVCAAAVYVVVNVIGIVRRTVAGDDVRWGRLASTAVLAIIAGTAGGVIGAYRRVQSMGESGGTRS